MNPGPRARAGTRLASGGCFRVTRERIRHAEYRTGGRTPREAHISGMGVIRQVDVTRTSREQRRFIHNSATLARTGIRSKAWNNLRGGLLRQVASAMAGGKGRVAPAPIFVYFQQMPATRQSHDERERLVLTDLEKHFPEQDSADQMNELIGFKPDPGRSRWLAQISPEFSAYPPKGHGQGMSHSSTGSVSDPDEGW